MVRFTQHVDNPSWPHHALCSNKTIPSISRRERDSSNAQTLPPSEPHFYPTSNSFGEKFLHTQSGQNTFLDFRAESWQLLWWPNSSAFKSPLCLVVTSQHLFTPGQTCRCWAARSRTGVGSRYSRILQEVRPPLKTRTVSWLRK